MMNRGGRSRLASMSTNKLIDFISTAKQFRVHTGNINAWGELKLRTFSNPTDELVECLKLQLQKWQPDDAEIHDAQQKSGGGGFLLCQGPFCMPFKAISQYPRDELKITIKSFLSKPNASDVRECLLALNRELQIEYADQLIVALPPADPDAIAPPSPAGQLEQMWPELEKLVTEGHVAALGVADLMVDDLKAIYERACSIKPLVNHYNIAACCTVPPELTDYAKQHDVVLLTHNDPHPFLTSEQVAELFTQCLNVPLNIAKSWEAAWAGRYTVMVKPRSVIAGKGYIVHFRKPHSD